jgi:signal transduction histidine kinase/ligand-binding sensor domain-containing protein
MFFSYLFFVGLGQLSKTFMQQKYLIFVVLMCFTNISFAQNLKFQHLSSKDGLSNSQTEQILEDKKGFVWIATHDGLNRYNGYNFTTYHYQYNDSTSLPGNFILCLAEDNDGNIWVGTKEKGLARYNYDLDNFKRYPNPDNTNGTDIQSLFNDSKGNIWIGKSDGLAKYNKSDDNFATVKLEPASQSREIVYSFAEMKDNTLIVGTSTGGMYFLDAGSKQFKNFNYFNNGVLQPLRIDTRTIVTTDTSIWFGNNTDGLFRYDLKTKQLKNYRTSENPNTIGNNMVKAILLDSRNNLWVATILGGACRYNSNKDNFTRFTYNKFDDFSLLSEGITDIMEDKNKNLWFAADLAGLSILNYSAFKFQHYYNNPLDISTIGSNIIYRFCEDNAGKIYLGTQNGLELLNSDHTFSHFVMPNSTNVFDDLAFDGHDKIYAVGWGCGLKEFDINTRKFKDLSVINNKSNRLQDLNIKGIEIDKDNNIWLAGHSAHGIHIYDPKNKEYFHALKPGNYNKNLFEINYPVEIFQDSKHRIWIVAYTGLFMFDGDFHKFLHDNNNNNTLSSDNNLCIYEDKEGNIWVGNMGGLDCIKEVNGTFKITRFQELYPIPTNIKAILQDDKGELWLSSNSGIIKFNSNTGNIKKYNMLNGLQGDEFSERSAFISSLGDMYFGGYNGFNIFNPDSMLKDTTRPNIYIINFQIFNKTQLPNTSGSPLKKSIIETEKITLSYKHSVISFEFVAFKNITSKKGEYAYKMEGFDKNWNYVGSERKATYTNLDPGTYHFKVKASNDNGIWNETGKTIEIIILPPWWKTMWFMILLFLFIATCLLSFYWWRINTLRRQKEKLEKLVEQKTVEVVSQKNELLSFNEELTVTNEKLYNHREELEATLTTLKDTQEQLVQAEKMASLGILSAGIAHEINNPLNYIYNGTVAIENYLKEKYAKDIEDLNPLFEAVGIGVERVTEIINSLSRYSINEELPFVNCNIQEVIDACLIILHNKYKNRIEIKKLYLPESPVLFANEGHLHQAFLNIIANAVQAIEKEGTIEIGVFLKNGHIIISISDTGKGISENHRKYIFDPFFTTKFHGEGKGLGLAITKKIIDEHKGTISCKSSLDRGTTFIINLPIHN